MPQGNTLPLSVVTVCKNNRESLSRMLASVAKIADEIVAVDSGSTDGTLETLEQAGAKILRTEWKGHIQTKQIALEQATRPWVLHLDSDEPIEPDLEASIRSLIETDDPAVAGARVNRKVWYRGRFLEHVWQPEWRLRLVRKEHVLSGKAHWGGRDPHDQLLLDPGAGRVSDLAGTLRHESFATFAEHLSKQLALSRIAAESMHAQKIPARRSRLLISPPGAFFKQLVLKQGWRDGSAGWLAAGSAAAGALMKHMIHIEIESNETSGSSGSDDPSS